MFAIKAPRMWYTLYLAGTTQHPGLQAVPSPPIHRRTRPAVGAGRGDRLSAAAGGKGRPRCTLPDNLLSSAESWLAKFPSRHPRRDSGPRPPCADHLQTVWFNQTRDKLQKAGCLQSASHPSRAHDLVALGSPDEKRDSPDEIKYDTQLASRAYPSEYIGIPMYYVPGYIYIYIYMYRCIHVCICTYMSISLYVYIYIYMYTYMYVYIYIYVYIHTYTCICI